MIEENSDYGVSLVRLGSQPSLRCVLQMTLQSSQRILATVARVHNDVAEIEVILVPPDSTIESSPSDPELEMLA